MIKRTLVAAGVTAVFFTLGCSSNITVPDKPPTIGPTFSMIVAADSQYPWWNAKPCSDCTTVECRTECEKRMGGAAIRDQIQAASKIATLSWPADMGGTGIVGPVGLIVNGDLTAYYHKWQVEEVDRLVGGELDKIRKSDPNNPLLSIIPFLGLGNHDYRNNVCDCRSWWPLDYNICARMAAHTMYRLYDKKYPWIRFNPCSLAYSWTLGKIRFVQLHLWPGYTADFEYWLNDGAACLAKPKRFSPDSRTCDDSVVFPSWDFLESELTAADMKGERSVLLFHDPEEYWSADDAQKFKDIVARHNVIAVFAGHLHGSWGVRSEYPIAAGLKNKSSTGVPVILTGASDNRKFAVAEFTANTMRVGVIAADGGTPAFQQATADNPTPRVTITW